jgi:tetratricopeptide (TPR) repeat protein
MERLAPHQIEPAFAQAQALQRSGQWQASEPLLRRIEASIPRHPAVCAALAHNAKQRGDLAAGEALLREAVDLAPSDPAFLNNLASNLLSQERAPEAEQFLRRALAARPDFPDAVYNLGRVHEEMQDPAAALAQFEAYSRLVPGEAKGYVRQAAHRLHREEYDRALAVCDAAAGRGLETYDLVYYRGCALAGLGRHAEALAAHERAAALAPGRWEARKGIANARFALGDTEGGLADLYRIGVDFPEQLSVHHEHSGRAWTAGRKDQYLATIEALRARGAMTPDHYTIGANLLIRAERVQDAIALMEEALRAAPGHSDVLGMMGTCLSHTADADTAAHYFEQSLRADSRNILTLQNYGYMCLAKQEHRRAVSLFETMLAIDPKHQLALAGLGLAYRETGDGRAEWLFDYDRFVRPFDIPLPDGFASVEAFNAALAGQLDALHTQKESPVDQTLRGGTQTPGELFAKRSGPLAGLHASLRQVIGTYLAQLPDDTGHPFLSRKTGDFRFSGSWSCKLKDGGFHTNHVHNMGWISSAYYVQLPPEMDRAAERKQGWISFGQSNLNSGLLDVPQHHVRPMVGRLVLFPSYLWHGTVPFESGTARMTVAFDAIPA